ncbi:DUF6042 family protein [Streptomyces lydicamycinicus]|uniref:DUF6042 family protein n=1 Tax=Streptomyces lydicamycinicus TaxID=1546107 RepID=UPI00203601DF|nr:DUF6042 family protein [Streptomyces lydicamycinicus]USA05462.1 DUF6042 family protein [Streptomyces lydicamycinicus]
MRTGPLVNGLTTYLVDDLGERQEVLTSLDRLAAATGRDADDVRIALAELVEAGDAQVHRVQAGRRGTVGGASALPSGHELGSLPRAPDAAERKADGERLRRALRTPQPSERGSCQRPPLSCWAWWEPKAHASS